MSLDQRTIENLRWTLLAANYFWERMPLPAPERCRMLNQWEHYAGLYKAAVQRFTPPESKQLTEALFPDYADHFIY